MIIGLRKFQKDINEMNPDYIIQFIKKHAERKNVALSINYNDDQLVGVNANEKLPLASTVKIIVAIEFAQQAAKGQIDPKKKVRLKDLGNLYVPHTDGGAHKAWIAQLRKQNVESVPLSEVAKGMITYSSNANTDYLIEHLGLQNINNVSESLGIVNHEPMYPIVSSLFIPGQLMNERNLTKQELLKEMKKMDMTEYRNRAIDIHNRFLQVSPTKQEKKSIRKVMNMNIQKNWSNRLPGSTTKEYISILEKLNSKTYFDKNIHHYLDPIMEQLMQSPSNREWLIHAGKKGGSTAFVLTSAMYAIDKDGNQTEFAFFSNDLTHIEQTKLSNNINGFHLKFLKDGEFRKRVKEELSTL